MSDFFVRARVLGFSLLGFRLVVAVVLLFTSVILVLISLVDRERKHAYMQMLMHSLGVKVFGTLMFSGLAACSGLACVCHQVLLANVRSAFSKIFFSNGAPRPLPPPKIL